jgi:hypothetical protein
MIVGPDGRLAKTLTAWAVKYHERAFKIAAKRVMAT